MKREAKEIKDTKKSIRTREKIRAWYGEQVYREKRRKK